MKKTLAVSLDDTLVDRLRKTASKENSSISRLVTIAVERYLKREEKKWVMYSKKYSSLMIQED